MNDPNEIRRDIERTRADLSDNVNALADQANPANVVRRQADKVAEGAADLKARIFGDPHDPWDDGAVGEARDRVAGAVGDARDGVAQAVGDARDGVAQAVHDAPRELGRRTRGNPLAAGLVAFGIGALVGGLLPGSEGEKRAARNVRDQAQPLVDEAAALAKEAVDHVRPQAEAAAQVVKDAAASASEAVKEQAQQATSDVQDSARDAQHCVQSDDRNPF